MEKIKLGNYFYLVNGNSKTLRKINWIGETTFEFSYGWGCLDRLSINSNKQSKVKFVYLINI